MHLKGKAAVVTGAGRGIGREVAKLLAAQGASVVVNDPGVGRGGEPTNERPADDVVNEIRKDGGKAVANYDSVADYLKAGLMIKQCVDEFGKIDILVNVAGNLRERMIWNMSEDDFDSVVSVHLKGHWNMCHHAIKYMRQEGHGRIVNFSSDAFKGSVGQCNYSASKAGIIALTRSIAKEAHKFGIVANAICPSADTRMTLTEAVKANRKRKFESGLMTKAEYERTLQPRGPEYIAPLVAYLCLDEADYINGQVFHIERGRIHTYYFGEDLKSLHKMDDDGMFTVDELREWVPGSLMNGITPVAPVVKMSEAMKASEAKKAG
ncbi:MAG TPA: SDR family NAD(P)-dependent oxidoreductase [Burkholderiales bacterium]|nr:SDR family NAD(P)-dependent oxidoreductase [Burkholderiales bacterium]